MIAVLTAETLPVEQFIRMVPPKVAEQGRALHRSGQATVQQNDPTQGIISVHAQPERPVQVTVRLVGNQVQLTCSCRGPYGWGYCKHGIAGVLALRDHLQHHPHSLWKAVFEQAIQRAPRRTGGGSGYTLLFSLQNRGQIWAIAPYQLANRHLGIDHEGDIELIARTIEQRQLWADVKPIRSQINPENFSTMPHEAITAASLLMTGGYYGYWSGGGRTLSSVLSLLHSCLVYSGDDANPARERLRVLKEPASVELDLTRAGEMLEVSAALIIGDEHLPLRRDRAHILTREPLWVLVEDRIVQIIEGGSAIEALSEYPKVQVPAKDQVEFFDNYLLPLAERIPVRGDMIAWDEVRAPAQPRLYLAERDENLLGELRFAYGDHELRYDKSLPPSSTRRIEGAQFARITRQPEAEQRAWQQLSEFGLKRGEQPHEFLLRRNTHILDFLLHQIPKLAAAGYTVFGEEALTTARVNRARPTISFNVSSGIDWFDMQAVIEFGDQQVALKDLRRAVRKREKYLKLADGSIGLIPEEWIERYRHLFALGEEQGDQLRLSQHHLTLIDQLLADADRAQTDAAFQERRERLRGFDKIAPQPLPRGLRVELRPYQQAGFDWLHFLHSYGFGGCLADDMGIGKTAQTLAFLLDLRERKPDRPADLVVMPRSLLFNWERETQTFTPGLRTYIHADQGRITDPEEFGKHDLVFTTYGVMLRDIELLRKYRFYYAILDESQAIKNPVAETSRAARLISAEHRLVLTGTPVENSTSELWSQFAYLNPGLLGNIEYFREEFVNPIERKQDEGTAQFLRKMVYPFILRRTKDQVALDLPPRSEEIMLTEMEPAQRKLYAKTRDHYRAMLLKLIDGEGIGNARMQVLEGLLRLRQICNHPRLVDEKARGGSGKFELLLETLDTLRAEGHKALIFSQFVQMLTIIREALDARKIPYAYLDGSTRNRQEEVDRFQGDPDLPFFLISLKAGGVGLNLTAADYVIHVDPWWNPAVEMQATDRTHRIGQTRPVFVYKLITRDSVEEKILQLQDRKRALVEQIISAEGSMLKSLTREDVEVLFT